MSEEAPAAAPVAETPVEAPAATPNETPVETPVEGSREPIGEVTQEPANDFTLPDEYKDKPWAEKIKSQEDAYKQIENLTALVGKKTIAPIDYETATPEEIQAYHASLAPEKGAEAYTWSEGSMEEITKPMGDLFVKAGLNTYQQNLIASGFDDVVEGLAIAKIKADTNAENYMAMMKESFGDDYEKTTGVIEQALKQHVVNDDDKRIFDSVDNTTRAAVDRTVHSLIDTYEKRIANILKEHGVTEGGAQVEGGEAGVGATTKAEQRSNIRQEMRDLDGKPNSHAKIAELQARLNKLL